MSIDLKKLENKLDEALSNETSETLNKFLTDKTMSNNKQQPKPENTNNQFSNTEPLTHAQRVAIANKMSNNKQSMKLYTEEQVKQMIEKSRETGLTADYLILANKGIELPSDEQIENEAEDYTDKFVATALYAFEDGAKWMRDKIQGGNK